MIVKEAKINDNRCAVIGLGYVGLPLVCGLSARNFCVTGIDINVQRIEDLKSFKSHIEGISDQKIKEIQEKQNVCFSTDFAELKKCKYIIVCVPTPITENKEPDLTYITSAAKLIAPHLSNEQLVCLESTTHPGTTKEIFIPEIEKHSCFIYEQDFFVAYAPEREDPGNKEYTIHNTPRVVGADDEKSLELAVNFYSQLTTEVCPVSSLACAEAVKITENVYRAVNIALVNELKIIYKEMGIDIWEVIEAAKTKPFGFTPFYPGPGIGGHCIPVDPYYLAWKSRSYDRNTRFIELAGEINSRMPYYIIDQIGYVLNLTKKQTFNGSNFLIMGVAYKKNISDFRNSPSLKIIEILERLGAKISVFDPHVQENAFKAALGNEITYLKGFKESDLSLFDAVIIATDHDKVDYEMICQNAHLVFDTKNVVSQLQGPHKNVYRI